MAEIKKRVYRFGGKHAEGDGKMRELPCFPQWDTHFSSLLR